MEIGDCLVRLGRVLGVREESVQPPLDTHPLPSSGTPALALPASTVTPGTGGVYLALSPQPGDS